MSAFFNSDGSFPLQFLIIFVVIFAVLAAIVLVFRRFSGRGMALSKSGPRGRQPRLGIVDIYELDRQRQLILLRRDNVEHLLLVGGPNDVIVERNIHRGAGARLPLDEAARAEALPEEPVFEPARPADPPVMQPPVFDEPRAPVPEPAAIVAAPVEPRGGATPEPKPAPPFSKADLLAAKAARRNPPPLVNLKPEVTDRPRPADTPPDVVAEPTVLTVGAPNPATAPGAPPPPVASAMVEAPSPERAARPQPPVKSAPVVEPAPAVPPPLARPTNSRPVDAAILSDMARQLEEALRRPSAAISPSSQAVPPTPPKAPPVPPAEPKTAAKPEPRPEPVAAEKAKAEQPIDPMAAAMAAPVDIVPDEPPAVPAKDKPMTAQPAPAEPVFADAAPREPSRSEPASTAPDVFLPAPPPPPAPKKVPAASQNPFSVEEIEAEFARLLGRPLDKKG